MSRKIYKHRQALMKKPLFRYSLRFLKMAAVWGCCDINVIKSVFKVCCRNFNRNETRMEKRPKNKARNVSPCFFFNLFIFPRITLWPQIDRTRWTAEGIMMGEAYKAKKQCEDDIEKNFANIIQQGLSSTLQALKSQLNNKPLPGNRFCLREGIGLHLQFCQLDIMAGP